MCFTSCKYAFAGVCYNNNDVVSTIWGYDIRGMDKIDCIFNYVRIQRCHISYIDMEVG